MYLVSACLAGVNCRHDAKNKINSEIKNLVDSGQVDDKPLNTFGDRERRSNDKFGGFKV